MDLNIQSGDVNYCFSLGFDNCGEKSRNQSLTIKFIENKIKTKLNKFESVCELLNEKMSVFSTLFSS